MRKLTPLEKENKEIENIIDKLKKLETKNNQDYFRRACSRYVTRTNEERRLKKDIKKAEEELAKLKKTKTR